MFSDLKEKELLTRHTINTNRTILREFADLIERLNFESSEIIALKKYLYARNTRNLLEKFKSLLVTNSVGVKKKQRYKLSSVKEYLKDSKSLFINYLYNVDKKQNKSIIFFFVRKSIYSAFFEKLLSLLLKKLYSRNNAVEERQTLKRQKLERQELKRQELEKQELKRTEQKRRELKRQ